MALSYSTQSFHILVTQGKLEWNGPKKLVPDPRASNDTPRNQLDLKQSRLEAGIFEELLLGRICGGKRHSMLKGKGVCVNK